MDFEEARDLKSDDEDCAHRLEMAMVLSRSIGDEEAVVGESLSEDVNLCDLPDLLTVNPIPGQGWCFYECVVAHLCLAENELTSSCVSAKASICALCLWCLGLRREEMVDFLCDSDEVLERRKRQVFERKEYRRHCEELDDFQIYVLDKLEGVLLEANVPDTLHYADSLEIEAFL